MESCDALIVGGGPAGSTVAWELSRAGMDVLVLDKSEFPRDKVCAGWITPAVLAELDIETDQYARRGRTLQPIRGFRVSCLGHGGIGAGGTELDSGLLVSYDQPVSFGILRREFDGFLLRRSGARLELATPVRSIERRRDRWIVNRSIEAPLLIGAGGHFCPVARHLAPGESEPEPIVAAQELEVRLSERQSEQCAVAGDVPELYFTDDLRGYGWCFRKGDSLNVGLGRQDRHGLPGHVMSFVELLRRAGRIPEDLVGPFKGHAYLIYGEAKRPLLTDGAMLVGDAAGLAYRMSGEGIRPAVESGLLASRVVLEAAGYARAELEPYRALLTSRFGPSERKPSRLPASWRVAIARKLFESPWFVRRVLIERWFLHQHEAPLARTTGPHQGVSRDLSLPAAGATG